MSVAIYMRITNCRVNEISEQEDDLNCWAANCGTDVQWFKDVATGKDVTPGPALTLG